MIRLCAFSDEAAADIYGQISALTRNNISYMELRGIDGINVSAFSEVQAKEYAKILKSEGIKVWAIGSPLGKVDINVDFNKYIDQVKKIYSSANIFETEKVRVFSFFNAYNDKNKVIEYLNRMTETASEYGLTLCHENEKDIYGDNAKRVIELLNSVNGLKSVYDPANFLQVGELADDTLSVLHAKSEYFHIKDVVQNTGELVPAGYGDGKITDLIAMINSDKVLTLEPHLAIFEGFSKIDGTQMKNKFHFDNNSTAFDAAVSALKKLLEINGYKETSGSYTKL